MAGRKQGILAVTALLFAVLLSTTEAAAQQTASARVRVLVPDFQPEADEDKNFGKDLAKELREAINQLNTHAAVDRDDIEDALDQFKLDWEDLNCIRARQLASQNNYQVVMCASYGASGGGIEVRNIEFVDATSGEGFGVDPIMSARKEEEVAAANIVEQFSYFVEQARAAVICSQYAASQQWDQALQNCNQSIDMNPEAVSVRYTRANIFRNMERWDEALEDVDAVLAVDPFHENALSLGGYVSIQLGDTERALGYYRQQLELDPTNAAVRMRIAYDVAQDGDPLAAMQLIEDGIELDAANDNFYNQHGNFAFAAARKVAEENRAMGGEEITPEVGELYRKAIASYQRVMDSAEVEILPSQVRNAAAAYLQLDEAEASAEFSRQALETFPDEAGIWMIHSDALREQGMVDEALSALQEVERIDPSTAQLHLRMANLMIQNDRVEEAVPFLVQAVETGTPADNAANMIFSNAYTRFMAPQQKNYNAFIEMIGLTGQFEVSDNAKQTYDFWHGWAIFQRAIALQEPSTLDSANATLPMFQQAQALFQGSKGYMDTQPSINYAEVIDNVGVYIEIQEAIIKRGR